MRFVDHVLATAIVSMVFGVLLAWFLCSERRRWQTGCRAPTACQGGVAELVAVGGANELSLAVWARCGSIEGPWVIDTGFAGAPVLALPWLHVQGPKASGSCTASYADTTAKMRKTVPSTTVCRHALDKFMVSSGASKFTAGCTSTLLGIGSETSVTTDMLLVPGLEMRTHDGSFFTPRACTSQVTSELLNSTNMATAHLITCDWLRQNAPCLIEPSAGKFSVAADVNRAQFLTFSKELRGGAFAARVNVEGVSFVVTVDTGSALTLALSASSGAKVRECRAIESMHTRQSGANGEKVCSDVVMCDVTLGGTSMQSVPIFINDVEISDDVDGYMGMGLLIGFDMLIEKDALSLRRNSTAIQFQGLLQTLHKGWCSKGPNCSSQQ